MNPRYPILALVSILCALAYLGFANLLREYIDLEAAYGVIQRVTLALFALTFIGLLLAGIVMYLHHTFKQYP